jgi:hypothetical protein
MKKSKSVPVVLVASIAAIALTGCSSQRQVRRCVDQFGNVLPDSQCVTSTTRRVGTGIYPFWVYGGTMNRGKVTGYSRTPSSSADIVDSRGSVVRRGFGGGTSTRSSSFGG